MVKQKVMERKYKRSIIYTQRGIRREEELTFERFIEGLYGCGEYFFYYRDKVIDIAFHFEAGKKIYELNINGYTDDAERYEFDTVDELINFKAFDNKSLTDIWEELEN